jgi:hypothetical protein
MKQEQSKNDRKREEREFYRSCVPVLGKPVLEIFTRTYETSLFPNQ